MYIQHNYAREGLKKRWLFLFMPVNVGQIILLLELVGFVRDRLPCISRFQILVLEKQRHLSENAKETKADEFLSQLKAVSCCEYPLVIDECPSTVVKAHIIGVQAGHPGP